VIETNSQLNHFKGRERSESRAEVGWNSLCNTFGLVDLMLTMQDCLQPAPIDYLIMQRQMSFRPQNLIDLSQFKVLLNRRNLSIVPRTIDGSSHFDVFALQELGTV